MAAPPRPARQPAPVAIGDREGRDGGKVIGGLMPAGSGYAPADVAVADGRLGDAAGGVRAPAALPARRLEHRHLLPGRGAHRVRGDEHGGALARNERRRDDDVRLTSAARQELELEPNDRIVRVNGRPVRD